MNVIDVQLFCFRKEDAIHHLEVELQQEKSMADNMVAHMVSFKLTHPKVLHSHYPAAHRLPHHQLLQAIAICWMFPINCMLFAWLVLGACLPGA